MSARAFDKAMRNVDEAGRMIHGWRSRLRADGSVAAQRVPRAAEELP